MTLRRVGIVCALASEARHLGPAKRGSADPAGSGIDTLPDGTLLTVTGMGPEAALLGARALCEAGANALAGWGLAGGLDPALPAGTILLPAAVRGRGEERFNTDRPWRERLTQALSSRGRVSNAELLSSERALGSIEEKARAFAATGAAAVDMESLSIARIASEQNLPFIAVRVIVDTALDSLPRAVTAAADRSGHLQIGRLIGSLARSPRELGSVLRLANRFRAANRSLALIARTRTLVPPESTDPDISATLLP